MFVEKLWEGWTIAVHKIREWLVVSGDQARCVEGRGVACSLVYVIVTRSYMEICDVTTNHINTALELHSQ